MRASPKSLLVTVVALVLSCGDEGTSPAPKAEPTGGLALLGSDCDPIVPTRCGLPLPSSSYMVDDPSTPTGKRIAFGPATLPAYADGRHLDAAAFGDYDGFSPGMPIVTHLPNAVAAGLPGHETIERSLAPDSPTVLLEADTGARVPHWAEIDATTTDSEQAALIIHPAVRLKDGARYIMAVRHMVDDASKEIAPSDVFRALRDGSDLDDASVRRRRGLYTDILGRLERAGVPRGDLQIAWDWVTASRDWTTRRMVAMRDDALAKVGTEGPAYTITKVEEDPNPRIARRITGTMSVPTYLDTIAPGGRLTLGPDGLPVQNGTSDVPFMVLVPKKLVATQEPGPLVQNGHGLLGSMTEGDDGYLATIADEQGYVAFACNLLGMSGKGDRDFIVQTIEKDVTMFRSAVDRQMQGILNELLLMRMMKGRFVSEPLAQGLIDPTRAYYRGDSQGGIFGVTYMALSTDVTRGLLGEPGMPYTLLLDRSKDFASFGFLVRVTFPNPLDVRIVLGLLQMMWDRSEPNGYAPYMTKDMLPGTPAHDVLLHVAIGDYQVTPLGAHMIARAVGAKNLAPVNRGVFGVPDAPAPLTGSVMVEFDFGLPPVPETNIAPSGEGDPHEDVRRMKEAITMADEFFRTGVVNQKCEGPCKGRRH